MTAVVFLSAQTMGDALGSSGRALRNTFERLGHEFVDVNLGQPNGIETLNRTISGGPIEFVFSYVGMAADFKGTSGDGREMNLWTALGVPFLSLYGDTPAYFFDRHILPGPLFAGLYGFPEHYQLRKRLPRVNGLLGVNPPAPVDPLPKHTIDFSAKERGKLLFLKNGNDPNKLISSWRAAVPAPVHLSLTDLASELAGQLQTPVGNDIDALVCSHFRSKGWDVEALTTLRLFFIAQLDDYLRRLKSTFIAEVLLDFPIEVHGYNWEHVDFSKRRATLISVADYEQSRTLINGSLGLLDMSPNTGLAPHDRPMRALGAYTLCLTNEQEYFKRACPQHEAFTFRFEKESLQARVADVLAHPRRYVELGISVAEAFRDGRDPDSFGQFLIDTASHVRLANASSLPGLQDYFVWPPKTPP
jgi:hypothetical protein